MKKINYIKLLKAKNNPQLKNLLINQTIKLKILSDSYFRQGASSSRNLFVCSLKIFPTADDINLLIRIAVALSNGSGRPPSSSKTLLSQSRLDIVEAK